MNFYIQIYLGILKTARLLVPQTPLTAIIGEKLLERFVSKSISKFKDELTEFCKRNV